jgi:xylulose-5-phosphate/fructose-6-phosphate phosphoketolase
MEILSEHSARAGSKAICSPAATAFFSCYEAFIHIVDSMFNQHAKWLKVCGEIPWRRPHRLAELPAHLACLAPGPQRLLAPGPRLHRPRGEQEGRHHPRLSAARRQHPAVVTDHCLRSRNYVNVIVAGKQPRRSG